MSVSRDLFDMAVDLCNYVGITPPAIRRGIGNSIHFLKLAFDQFPPGGISGSGAPVVLASMFMHGDASLSNLGFNTNFAGSTVHPSSGNYTISFTNPLPNLKYSFFVTSTAGSLTARYGPAGFSNTGSGANQLSSLNYEILNAANALTNEDHWITIIATLA
jgi:hypothetical protein